MYFTSSEKAFYMVWVSIQELEISIEEFGRAPPHWAFTYRVGTASLLDASLFQIYQHASRKPSEKLHAERLHTLATDINKKG